MLVLSRKLGEEIRISDGELTVTVIAIEGARVRLGIAAPSAVAIVREECRGKTNTQARIPPPENDNRSLHQTG